MIDLAFLAKLDATAQATLCARREISAEQLYDAALARISALNPLLRAVVQVAGERPHIPKTGPFCGVPFLMKDASPWPGMRWSMGSRLFAHNRAQQHTPFGKRLDEAGLMCVGKSATSEFGLLASTESALEGATLNPWNLAYSSGGSSGGSAAAVAAGLVPIAHANDGGGSIRVPASVCGVFGFKPSRSHVVVASFASSDFGEMTSDHCISRSVRDSALFHALTEDRASSDGPGFVREASGKRLRIAVYTRTLQGHEPQPAVLAALRDAAALLSDLGHAVEWINAPSFSGPELADAFFLVAGAAVAAVVHAVDARRGVAVQSEELEPFTWALIDAYVARGADALSDARNTFMQAVLAYRATTREYDAVLTPTLATTPWLLGHLSPWLDRHTLMNRTSEALGYTPLQNIAGCPAMSVPLHFPEGGLPIGAHFAAAPGADATLLSLAYELEQARPWRDRWPPYSIPALFESRV